MMNPQGWPGVLRSSFTVKLSHTYNEEHADRVVIEMYACHCMMHLQCSSQHFNNSDCTWKRSSGVCVRKN